MVKCPPFSAGETETRKLNNLTSLCWATLSNSSLFLALFSTQRKQTRKFWPGVNRCHTISLEQIFKLFINSIPGALMKSYAFTPTGRCLRPCVVSPGSWQGAPHGEGPAIRQRASAPYTPGQSVHTCSQDPLRSKKFHVYVKLSIWQGFQKGLWQKKKKSRLLYTPTHGDLEVQIIFTKVSLFLENVFEVESAVEGWLPVLQQSFLLSIPPQGCGFHGASVEPTSPLGEIRVHPLDQVFKLHNHLFGNSDDFILQEVVREEQNMIGGWEANDQLSTKPLWNTVWVD